MRNDRNKVEDAINRMHHAANDVIHHARHARSKSTDWEGLCWQKELLEYARRYTKSIDRLTRVRSITRKK